MHELIAKIDDNPDNLHMDYTPAVHQLIDIGLPALKNGVLDLLLSDDQETREHAETVLSGISAGMYGFRAGKGWENPDRSEQWRQLWDGMGYHYKASPEARKRAYLRWRSWLRKQG